MGQSHDPSQSHCSLAALFKNLLNEALQIFSENTAPVTFTGTCPACEPSQAQNRSEGKMLGPQLPCRGLVGGDLAACLGLQLTVGAEEKSLGGQHSKR